MRVVLDTNVLLAGFATHGLCAALVLLCLRDHQVVVCDHILNELATHYRDKFKATPEQVEAVLSMLRLHTESVVPAAVPWEAFADADDLPVLGAAVAGSAACIVTGDKQLIELGAYQGVSILSPRAFYDRLRSG